MIRGARIISQEEQQRYRTNFPNAKNQLRQPLYDFILYPAAGQLLFTFFQLPVGQGVTSAFGGAGAKTFIDTNMEAAGQLPAGFTQFVEAVAVDYYPNLEIGRTGLQALVGQFADDVWVVLRNGVLTFRIANKIVYRDAPLLKAPGEAGLGGFAGLSDATTAGAALFSTADYARSAGMVAQIVPQEIIPNQNFSVTIEFPALIATPSAATGRLGVRLLGNQIQPVQ